MRRHILLAAALGALVCGCSTPARFGQTITSVTPSASGTPNSVAIFGNFELVSVQGTGQIFTYDLSSGVQVLAASPYATPCSEPSGMLPATIAGTNVLAVTCFDTASLLTLTIHSDGSLSALGAVSGLPMPYPGIALDGTDVLVPLFGQSSAANGSVARVSIASPATPVVTGSVTIASAAPGQFVNPVSLVVAGGYIFVAAGSEDAPQSSSSTIQVVNESTMTLVGAPLSAPLSVPHSPQQIAVQGTVAYVTLFDAAELESIDISNPASLSRLQVLPLTTGNSSCNALPIAVAGQYAYVGCYNDAKVEQFSIANPSSLQLSQTLTGIDSPQQLRFTGQSLLVTSSVPGGHVYQIDVGNH